MSHRFYCSFASGSKGNCGLYVDADCTILIDLGISVRTLKTLCAEHALSVEQIDGVLLTHEHTDHIKGLTTFCKNYEIPIYATEGTAQAVCQKLAISQEKFRTFTADDKIPIKHLCIQSFPTPHDGAESVGYVLQSASGTFGYVTDLGFVPKRIAQILQGCDSVVLESNHDPYLLKTGPYPWHLKERVASAQGHLSNQDCASLAYQLAKSGTHTFILAHLSEQNNTAKLAQLETEQALKMANVPFQLIVATQEPMPQKIILS